MLHVVPNAPNLPTVITQHRITEHADYPPKLCKEVRVAVGRTRLRTPNMSFKPTKQQNQQTTIDTILSRVFNNNISHEFGRGAEQTTHT